ncbi:MAG: amino acid adenylation domain-containing protein [Clostridia bacterium]|nr:amino acid adenylation domain-containing protein [Clostridia bacterium]
MNRIEDVYGLTPVQEGMYAQYFLNKKTDAYNLYYLFSIRDNTDPRLLQQAIMLLPVRHPVLKTAFAVVDGNIKQVILSDRVPAFNTVSFSCDDTSDLFEYAVNAEKERMFDLQRDPLVRCTLYLSGNAKYLFIHTHHLITDGWGSAIIIRDLNKYCLALMNGEAVESIEKRLVEERNSQTPFSAYVNSIRQRDPVDAHRYWNDLVKNHTPVSLPKQEIMTPGIKRVERIYSSVPAYIRQSAERMARSKAFPVNTILESAFALALKKHTGVSDILFFKVISGRAFGIPGIENTPGPMINTVPVRIQCEEAMTLLEYMEKVNEQGISANDFGFLPLSEICGKNGIDPKKNGILFDFGNYMTPESNSIQPISFLKTEEQTEFPLTCILSPDESSFCLTAIYDTASVSPFFVNSLLNSFIAVLEKLCGLNDGQLNDPEKMKDICGLDPAEHRILFGYPPDSQCSDNKAGIRNGFSVGETVAIPDKSVYALFEEQAKQTPDKVCIKGSGFSKSFGEFYSDTIRIASYLKDKVTKGKVGVICDRSYEELTAIFGIVRDGNAYVPVDPNIPPARKEFILGDCGCEMVLCNEKYTDLSSKCVSIGSILADKDPVESLPPAEATPDDLLYVIYTSGSTGAPKGACVTNRSVVNRLEWMTRQYFNPDTVVMLKTPYTFDVSVWEIFSFAISGFGIYILGAEDHYRYDRVVDAIQAGGVTDIHFVPTVFRGFIDELKRTDSNGSKLASLRNIYLSGEKLTAEPVNAFKIFDTEDHIKIHNLYGPAECAVDVSYYDCKKKETDPVPIGRPIWNTQLYIVDKYMNPVPIGVTGELCIAGANVGAGYINRPDLTAGKFIENPFGEGKLYKTGDLAYWREDGNIIFVGRNDLQVKINGQRVELGEIESAVQAVDGVNAAAVILKHDPDRLIAFYTGTPAEADVSSAVKKSLPVYMRPGSYIKSDALPVNPNGKTDRLALESTDITETMANQDYNPPINESEKMICDLFAEILPHKKIGRDSDFFESGGTSLLLIRLLSRTPLDVLTPSEFMRDPTPAGIAKNLDSGINWNYTYVVPLYLAQNSNQAVVLFPYAGGDASSYTSLVSDARRSDSPISLYYADWPEKEQLPVIAEEIRDLASGKDVIFYSHCAGAALALSLLDILNSKTRIIKNYIAGGNIPPRKSLFHVNSWMHMSDSAIVKALTKAGLDLGTSDGALLQERLESFRLHTQICADYYRQKADLTDVCATIIISKNDPLTPDYNDAESRWLKVVKDVRQVVYINTSTHYFQNTDSNILFDLFISIFD